jgi:hypothetical protein
MRENRDVALESGILALLRSYAVERADHVDDDGS